jgi:predicted permease
VFSALAERWNPTWLSHQKPSNEGGRMGQFVSDWTKDFRHALRALKRSPGFTAVAVGTLGLAIGANTGIFSVLNTVLLNPLPFPDADQLVYIGGTAPGSDMPAEFDLGLEFLVQYAEESKLLTSIAGYNDFTNTLRVEDRAERIWMSAPTLSLFSVLGTNPMLGRLPVAADAESCPSGPGGCLLDVAVISHALWTTWFGADPSVIGKRYYMAGDMRTVVGVMPPEFRFPNDAVLLWIPVVIRADGLVPGRFGAPGVARLAPGATRAALTLELTTLARRLPERFGGSANYARIIQQFRPVFRPLKDHLVGDVSRALWVLLASVGIVLLIACANVANLLIVRADGRQRDLAIRRAIGAGRGRLFRTEMAESLIVAALAGVLAVVLAWISVPLVVSAAPSEIPRLGDVRISMPALLVTTALSLFAALLCGFVPALQSSMPNLTRLRDGSRGSTRRRHWGRDALVVVQTALALVLLIGSGLLVRSFQQLRDVDPGYDTEDIFTFQIAPEGSDLTDGPSFARFHTEFMNRLGALPGVESVGIIENVPLNEGTNGASFQTEETAGDPEAAVPLRLTFAGGPYFETMGISVLAGRAFTTADHVSNLGNIVVSRTAANLLWPGQDPIGRRLRREDLETWETVVGVVEDVLQYGLRSTPEPLVYFPLVGQTPMSWVLPSPAYVMKTRRAESIAPEVRALVQEVAPGAPMYRAFTMSDLVADSMVQLSFTMLTLGITSMLALILGAVGLYGVLSYVVGQRTREIGVRMALGAEARRVRGMVVAQGVRVVLIGVAIGVLAALVTTRALGSLLFGVQAVDLATFLGMSATMVVIGLLASYVPARRASNVDPMESLRVE